MSMSYEISWQVRSTDLVSFIKQTYNKSIFSYILETLTKWMFSFANFIAKNLHNIRITEEIFFVWILCVGLEFDYN